MNQYEYGHKNIKEHDTQNQYPGYLSKEGNGKSQTSKINYI